MSHGMPEEIAKAKTFEELRESAVSFAEVRERLETKGREGKRVRSHYRAVVSFERQLETERAAALVAEWLKEAFPEARAMAFTHQNTEHTHAHIWIDARKPDGRKLHFSRQEYRRLDEVWNRIYSRELGRDEAEHLSKKYDERDSNKSRRDGDESRKDSSPRGGARADTPSARAGRTAPTEHALETAERTIEAAHRADERALHALDRLHRDATKLGREAGRDAEQPERVARPWSHESEYGRYDREG